MLTLPTSPSKDKSLLIATSNDITSAWVSSLLKTPATVIDVSSVGSGQMAKTVRVKFQVEGAKEAEVESLIVKIASESEESQAMGFGGAYEVETVLYADLGEQLAASTAVPTCFLAVYEPKGIFTLVLEDMATSVQGNQLDGCGKEVAISCLSALAKFQAPIFGNWDVPKKSPWMVGTGTFFDPAEIYAQTLPTFLERYHDLVSPEHAEFCKWLVPHVKEWLDERKEDIVFGLRHRDYRLDNILFPTLEGDKRVVAVDFQGASWGNALEDASFFMGSSMIPAERKLCDKELLQGYLDEVTGGDKSKISWDKAWYQYRRGTIFGILQAVWASILCVRTPRGDIMFTTLLRRHAEMCLDLDVKELFP